MILAIFSFFIQTQAFSATSGLVVLNDSKSITYNNSIRREDVELFIPTNIKEGSDGKTVQKKVLDHCFRNFIKGKMTPGATVFRNVQKIERAMKYDIVSTKKEHDNDIQHKLNIQYRPFQNIAKLKYSGLLNANIEYLASESFLKYSIEKGLSKDTKLLLIQSKDPVSTNKSTLTMLNLRLSWD